MKDYIEKRVLEEAEYIALTGATVRETGKIKHYSKSTVHKDMTERLPKIDSNLYEKVKKVLELNYNERHLRGGEATKQKYLKIKKTEA